VPFPARRPAPALLRLTAVLLLAAGLLVTIPATASAHTGLRTTEPAADSTVTATPQAVTLTFSASVLGGEVTVTGPDGAPVGAGPVAHDGAVLTAPVALTAAGTHTVTWTAVADDGHALDGTFVFEHAPATPLPAPGTSAPAPTPDQAAPTTTSPTATTGTGTSTDPETASASSDTGGLPGWVLPVGAVVLLAVGGLTALRFRRR
jgi:hypothetical protein